MNINEVYRVDMDMEPVGYGHGILSWIWTMDMEPVGYGQRSVSVG